jgi:hypothetical protein
MKTVTLKNGSVEPENIVKAIQSSVNKMLEKDITGYIAMLDLMQICRNEKEINDLEQAELAILTSYGLIDHEGRIHETTKNVVLSMAQGEGLTTTFGSPC